MLKMISDYMENGFLDNIIDMFKHDESLIPMIGELLEDERSRVRVGTVALVETLMAEGMDNIQVAIPRIAEALKNINPTIRGDAAYLLGIIKHKDALPFLMEVVDDEYNLVRDTVKEAIDEINRLDSDQDRTS